MFQSKAKQGTNTYEQKTRRIIVRQTTKLPDDDEIYKDIGYIELNLNEIVALKTKKALKLPLIDLDSETNPLASGSIFLTVGLRNTTYAGNDEFNASLSNENIHTISEHDYHKD